MAFSSACQCYYITKIFICNTYSDSFLFTLLKSVASCRCNAISNVISLVRTLKYFNNTRLHTINKIY